MSCKHTCDANVKTHIHKKEMQQQYTVNKNAAITQNGSKNLQNIQQQTCAKINLESGV